VRRKSYSDRSRHRAGADTRGIAFTDSGCFAFTNAGGLTFADTHSGHRAQQHGD